ncbi:MAG: hypothetical protein HN576_00870 [Bacteriovoracaceae bacterium]|jgi:hypothetical protein|nr:hypothetical protein [Bacteriovoracaceae bacterium]
MIKLTISLFIFVLILTVSANSSEEVNNLKKTDRPDVVLFVPGAGSSGSQMGGIGVGEILGWIRKNHFFKFYTKKLDEENIKSFICPKAKDKDRRTLSERKEECVTQILESTYCKKENNHQKRTIAIFGHSMGGLIGRLVAKDHRVSPCIHSVTTLSTPHKGTAIADFVIRSSNEGTWLNIYNWVIYALDFNPKNKRYLKELVMNRNNIRGGSQQFLAQDISMNKDVYYYSFSSSFQETMILPLYKTQEIISNEMKEIFGKDYDTINDGIVPEKSQIYGEYLGHIESTHFEAVCPDMLTKSVGCRNGTPIIMKHFKKLFK